MDTTKMLDEVTDSVSDKMLMYGDLGVVDINDSLSVVPLEHRQEVVKQLSTWAKNRGHAVYLDDGFYKLSSKSHYFWHMVVPAVAGTFLFVTFITMIAIALFIPR